MKLSIEEAFNLLSHWAYMAPKTGIEHDRTQLATQVIAEFIKEHMVPAQTED